MPAWLRRLGQTLRRREAAVSGALLFAGIGVYTLVFGLFTVGQHRKFFTSAYDLGINVNTFWNTTLNGRFMQCSYCWYTQDQQYLNDHVELLPIALLGPVFRFVPGAETLLVLQSLVLALGAWPVFLVARRVLESRAAALVLAGCYLLNPITHAANFFDFHQLCFVPVVFGFMLHFALRRHWLYYVFLFALLLIKEDMVFVAGFFAAFLVLEDRRWRDALATLGMAGLWMLFVKLVIHRDVEAYTHYFYFSELIPEGGTPLDLLETFATRPREALAVMLKPAKLRFLLQMLFPLAFLPLIAPRRVFLFLYGLLVSLLATINGPYTVGFHYAWYWLPGLFMAAVLVLGDVAGQRSWLARFAGLRSLLAATAVCTGIACALYGVASGERFRTAFYPVVLGMTEWDERRYACFERLVREHVPDDASVLASETLCPHLSMREKVDSIRFFRGRPSLESSHFDLVVLATAPLATANPWDVKGIEESGMFRKKVAECGFAIFENELSEPEFQARYGEAREP